MFAMVRKLLPALSVHFAQFLQPQEFSVNDFSQWLLPLLTFPASQTGLEIHLEKSPM